MTPVSSICGCHVKFYCYENLPHVLLKKLRFTGRPALYLRRSKYDRDIRNFWNPTVRVELERRGELIKWVNIGDSQV